MLALLATLLVLQAPPDVQAARDALPPHVLTTCAQDKLMCFQFEPFKLLLGQSNERLHLLTKKGLLEQKLKLLDLENKTMNAELDVRAMQLVTWKTDHARLLEKWEKENKLRHRAEMKANSPWPIVTMVVGSLLGVSGALWGAFNSEDPAPWVMTGAGVLVTGVGVIDLFF